MSAFAARLRDARVVPVIRHGDPELALQACELLAQAGLSALEVTTTVPGADRLIAELRQRYGEICVGAGTVLREAQAQAVLRAGAEFVVSPCWSEAAARPVMEAGIPYLPGAVTPGEVHHHFASGADVVKVFPADTTGGPGYLRSLTTVFPDIPLMPTGGVSPANAQDYLDAGALCVGMGGQLLPVKELEAGDRDGAVARIRAALAILNPAN